MTTTASNVLGFVLMAIAGASVAGLNMLKEDFAPVDLNPETLCPVNASVSEHVALLVDRTDPMPEARAALMTEIVRELARKTPVQGRFSVYLLTDDAQKSSVPALDICNPGDGSSVDPMFANTRRIQARFDSRFAKPVNELAVSLVEGAVAPQSPIIETIAQIAAQLDQTAPVRRIVIASDFLQHTNEMSHYRGSISVGAALASKAGHTLADGRLSKVEINMIYLETQTSPNRQGDDNHHFWKELITSAGGLVPNSTAVQLADHARAAPGLDSTP